jgi:hypothetical protein
MTICKQQVRSLFHLQKLTEGIRLRVRARMILRAGDQLCIQRRLRGILEICKRYSEIPKPALDRTLGVSMIFYVPQEMLRRLPKYSILSEPVGQYSNTVPKTELEFGLSAYLAEDEG